MPTPAHVLPGSIDQPNRSVCVFVSAQARLLTEKRKRVELMEKTEMLLNKTERNLSEATVKELEAFLSHDKQYETDLCSRLKVRALDCNLSSRH